MASSVQYLRPISFFAALSIQMRVIGALLMRELHTRYGRENIGYLWLIGEPMILATVIGSLHHGGHTPYGSDFHPLPFAVLGYTTYIIFRGIVNRSAGTLESSGSLLYHRMVTVLDVIIARSLLEAAGVFLAFFILMTLMVTTGLANLPVRPLYLILGQVLVLWYSWVNSLIISAVTNDNRTLERVLHPYTYFMIPLSGSFYRVAWVPEPYRDWLLYVPLPHMFEIVRYGMFRSADLKYVDFPYIIAVCAVGTVIGLICVKISRAKMHLA